VFAPICVPVPVLILPSLRRFMRHVTRCINDRGVSRCCSLIRLIGKEEKPKEQIPIQKGCWKREQAYQKTYQIS